MTASSDGSKSPNVNELADRIAQIEARLYKIDDCLVALFDRIDDLELKREADFHNAQIDKLLDEYESKNRRPKD